MLFSDQEYADSVISRQKPARGKLQGTAALRGLMLDDGWRNGTSEIIAWQQRRGSREGRGRRRNCRRRSPEPRARTDDEQIDTDGWPPHAPTWSPPRPEPLPRRGPLPPGKLCTCAEATGPFSDSGSGGSAFYADTARKGVSFSRSSFVGRSCLSPRRRGCSFFLPAPAADVVARLATAEVAQRTCPDSREEESR